MDAKLVSEDMLKEVSIQKLRLRFMMEMKKAQYFPLIQKPQLGHGIATLTHLSNEMEKVKDKAPNIAHSRQLTLVK
ncbi:hypothetical protein LDL77_08400 [Flagellimonas marinaquae]|uniref:50S ribosomal protein L29 n=2 Tax=Flagellimonas TaxID=444459 RepID=A0ABS7EMU0_9FLAO|nr:MULTISPECIES: hypothetical protein [Allomuricauda]MAO17506.1 hypothetical protein [Allomuricauda sp.]MBO0352718.1 hypothetical protein [Allomuricauda aurea]MBW8198885.1 hypothetical protein [Allomuricauda abyssi]UBZ15724.1 hypothetical protein LDL77_08400 [Allomuricauda aquimarina]